MRAELTSLQIGRATDMYRSLIVLIGAFPLLAACSTTPGDAAYRTGHPEEAAELYLRGAQSGDDKAALKLGLLLESDVVDAGRFGTATTWFERACELGNVTGCHNAGVGLEYGKDGHGKDYMKAGTYYRKAAERGYMQSQYNLGSLHANQHLSDDIEGLKWLLLSQVNAKKCAPEELCQWILNDPPGHIEALTQRMTQVQIEEAHQRAAQFSPID